jgi:hypothetical protein
MLTPCEESVSRRGDVMMLVEVEATSWREKGGDDASLAYANLIEPKNDKNLRG